MGKLDVKAAGLALGTVCGLYMLVLGWMASFGWGVKLVEVLSSIYVGFTPGFAGGITGAVWGFIDGLIGGVIIALTYNFFTRR
jgi:hypothetical protein